MLHLQVQAIPEMSDFGKRAIEMAESEKTLAKSSSGTRLKRSSSQRFKIHKVSLLIGLLFLSDTFQNIRSFYNFGVLSIH